MGSRLAMSVIRNGYLWICQAVGLSGTNGNYSGDKTGTNVDRSAIQWFKLSVGSVGGSLGYTAHGRVYDRAVTNAYWYHFPSLMVNCAGDVMMGFSGSGNTNYIGAFYTWRLAGGSTLDVPRLIRAGTTNYPNFRWGDYSATTLDPTDDWSFWSVQEYADLLGDPEGIYPFRTVIVKVRPVP